MTRASAIRVTLARRQSAELYLEQETIKVQAFIRGSLQRQRVRKVMAVISMLKNSIECWCADEKTGVRVAACMEVPLGETTAQRTTYRIQEAQYCGVYHHHHHQLQKVITIKHYHTTPSSQHDHHCSFAGGTKS